MAGCRVSQRSNESEETLAGSNFEPPHVVKPAAIFLGRAAISFGSFRLGARRKTRRGPVPLTFVCPFSRKPRQHVNVVRRPHRSVTTHRFVSLSGGTCRHFDCSSDKSEGPSTYDVNR
jgi:hypothetical protein